MKADNILDYKHISLIVALLLSLNILLNAQDEKKKIQFNTIEHDFGTLKQGTPAEFHFEFTNVSSDTVFLDNPKASCGCTAALLSEKILPPDAQGTVAVRFMPPIGAHGNVTKTVTVYSQNKNEALEVLRIKARIIGDIEPNLDVVRFDAIAGEKKVLTVGLKSISDQKITFDNMSASLMEYRDTSAGDRYHSDKVIAKPFTNFALSTSKLSLNPKDSCDLIFVLTPESKGQINGSIRIATGKYETIISIAGVILRKKLTGSNLIH